MNSVIDQGLVCVKNYRKYEKVLVLSYSNARDFFLKNESYCNLELPKYFDFQELLHDISKKIDGKKLSSFFVNDKKPDQFDDVNHKILHNKDGKYAWRPSQLINPVLYVALVHEITDKQNWKIITSRFLEFSKNKKIECMSLPLKSISCDTDKAVQISKWWRKVEQKSIELALEYQYMVKTDITDCYGAIYTHSVSWALHTKKVAKNNRFDKKLLGNVIDQLLRDMCHGQTNGIPQGSSLMDFVAEMVLGYADNLLDQKINGKVSDYHIIRYRDDYRIFTNNPVDGDIIIKYLCEVLIDLGLKLNPDKTTSSQNIIALSVKEDKRFWNKQTQYHKNLQKQLLIIHDLSYKYPNSGSLIKALRAYSIKIKNAKIEKNNISSLISIIVDIAYNNPRTYPESSAILSKLISYIDDKARKLEIFDKIKYRFNTIPNTGHLHLWLQRITVTIDKNYDYSEGLCKLVSEKNIQLWNLEWVDTSLSGIVNTEKIIKRKSIISLPEVIQDQEIKYFCY